MTPTRFLIPALAIAMLAGAGTSLAQRYDGPPAFRHYGDGNAEQALEQRGFRDEYKVRERDYQNHRRPDVNNRDEYRNPNFLPWAQHEYREGFRRGYYPRVKQVYYGENRGYGNGYGRGYGNGYDR